MNEKIPDRCSRCGATIAEAQICEVRRVVRITEDGVEYKTRPRILCPICRKASKKRQ